MVAVAVGEQRVPGLAGLQADGALVAHRHVDALHVFVHAAGTPKEGRWFALIPEI